MQILTPRMFRKATSTIALIASMAACVPAGSGPRTQPESPRRGKMEIRIENQNWSIARVYVAANGSKPRKIATVGTGRIETKFVRINTARFVLVVAFIAAGETWTGFTEWSSEEECLHITIMNALFLTNVVPCWRIKQPRTEQ